MTPNPEALAEHLETLPDILRRLNESMEHLYEKLSRLQKGEEVD